MATARNISKVRWIDRNGRLVGFEIREQHRQRLENETGIPMTYCRQCGTGPSCLIERAPWADLCLDCRQPLNREANGWTPENSID